MSRWSLALLPSVVLLSREASALPAPLSDTELNDQSALIVDVTVTDAKCESVVDASDKVTTSVASTLQVDATVKGTAPSPLVFKGYSIEWKGGMPSCSAITAPIGKGWRGRLYLSATNDLVAWNGVKEDTATSKPTGWVPCSGGAGGAGGSSAAGAGGSSAGAAGTAGTGTAGTGTAGTGTAGGGTAGASGSPPADEDDGGCSVAAPGAGTAGLAGLGLAALVLGATRRRRR